MLYFCRRCEKTLRENEVVWVSSDEPGSYGRVSVCEKCQKEAK